MPDMSDFPPPHTYGEALVQGLLDPDIDERGLASPTITLEPCSRVRPHSRHVYRGIGYPYNLHYCGGKPTTEQVLRTRLTPVLSYHDGALISHIAPGGEMIPLVDQVMEVITPFLPETNADQIQQPQAALKDANERITELEREAEHAEDRYDKLSQAVTTAMVAFDLPIDLRMSDEEVLDGVRQMVITWAESQRAQADAESLPATSEGDRPEAPSEAARDYVRAVRQHLYERHGVEDRDLRRPEAVCAEHHRQHLMSTECDHAEVDLSGYLDIEGFSSSQVGSTLLRSQDAPDDLRTSDQKPNDVRSLDIAEARQHAIKVLEDQEAERAAIDDATFRRERIADVVETVRTTDPDPDVIEDGHGSSWRRCGAGCDLDVVRPGQVQCNRTSYHCADRDAYHPNATPTAEELNIPSLDAALRWAVKEHTPAGQFPDTQYCAGCEQNWPCEAEVLRRGVEVLRTFYMERISGTDVARSEDLLCHCGAQADIVGSGTGVLWCSHCKLGGGCPACR